MADPNETLAEKAGIGPEVTESSAWQAIIPETTEDLPPTGNTATDTTPTTSGD